MVRKISKYDDKILIDLIANTLKSKLTPEIQTDSGSIRIASLTDPADHYASWFYEYNSGDSFVKFAGRNGSDIKDTIIVIGNTSKAIQDAINDLPAGGGKVILLDQTYTITSSINLNKANVTLEGSGLSSILDADALASNVVNVLVDGLRLKNFLISCSDTTGGTVTSALQGIVFGQNLDDIVVENVQIKNSWSRGIYVNTGCANLRIVNCDIMEFTDIGLFLSTDENVKVDRCTLISAYGLKGIDAGICTALHLGNNYIKLSLVGSNLIGIDFQQATRCILHSNNVVVEGNGAGAMLGVYGNVAGVASVIANNSFLVTNAGAGAGIGINISNGDYYIVDGNNSYGSKTANSIAGTGIVVGDNVDNA